MRKWIARECALSSVILTLVIGIAPLSGNRASEMKDLSVCDLMSRLTKERYKVVKVHGELYSSSEITALGSDPCATQFTAGGVRWPAALDLVSSEYRTDPKERAAPFVTDPAAMARLRAAIAERNRLNRGAKLIVTITGFLRARQKYVRMMTGYGSQGNGYGHLGLYPAQLVIKTVDDIRIESQH